MKKKNIIFNESAAYESPQIHIFMMEVEDVLCGSVGGDDGLDPEDPDFGGDVGGWG